MLKESECFMYVSWSMDKPETDCYSRELTLIHILSKNTETSS